MPSTARPVALMYQSLSMPGAPTPQRPTIHRHDTSPAVLRAAVEPKFLRLSSYNMADVYNMARLLEVQVQKQAEANARERKREDFLLSVLKAMSHFGASLNALEDRMLHAARELDLKLKVVRQAHTITCYLGEPSTRRRVLTIRRPAMKTELAFGLAQVQCIYDAVVNKQLKLGSASARLQQIRALPSSGMHIITILASTIISTMFATALPGAGPMDAIVTFIGTLSLGFLHHNVGMKARFWADLFETATTIALATWIHDGGFFATGLIAIIPGFMHLCAASKRKQTFAQNSATVAAFAFAYAYALAYGLPTVLDFVLMVKVVTLGFYLRALVVPASTAASSLKSGSMPGSKQSIA